MAPESRIIDAKKLQRRLKARGKKQYLLADAVIVGKDRASKASIFSKLKNGGEPVDLDLLERMAEWLDCEIDEFCLEAEEVLAFWHRSEIERLYEPMGPGDVVSIVSADGFLEADDVRLFKLMVEQVLKGVEVRYYYPRQRSSRSFVDFAQLLAAYRKALAGQNPEGSVSGFQVPTTHERLFGWHTRRVVFAKWDDKHEKQQVEHVFLYTEYSPAERSRDKDTGTGRIWVRLRKGQGRDFYQDLCCASEPIANLGVYQNRLDSRIQETYRTNFCFVDSVQFYTKVRQVTQTTEVLRRLFKEAVIDDWLGEFREAHRGLPVIRMLDIGSGDGVATARALRILERRIGANGAVRLTSVESAHVPARFRDPCIKGVHTPSPKTPFEDWETEECFDLILAVHSFYLIDPLYLLKAYELLSHNGILAIVTAPRKDNALNSICAAVDRYLPEADSTIPKLKPYPEKVVRNDPFRNFAEDLHEAARHLFQGQGIHESRYELLLNRTIIVRENGHLTDFGRDLVALFSFGWLDERRFRKVEAEAVAEIAKTAKGSKVRNDAWLLLVTKADVRKHLRKKVNGKII